MTRDCVTAEGQHVGSTLVNRFLEGIFESKERDIEAYLPGWFDKLLGNKVLIEKDFVFGIAEFLKGICDLESDVPLISKWFTRHVVIPLMERKVIDVKQLAWPLPNDEMYSFDAYFKVAAEIFKHQK